MGKVVSRRGEFAVVAIGIVIILIASFSYTFVSSVGPSIFFVRVIHGLGFSAFIAGSFSLVAKDFPPQKRAQAYGVVGAAMMGASALSPPIGEILIKNWGFFSLYLAATLATVLALGVISVARADMSPPPLSHLQKGMSYSRLIKDRSLLYVLVSTLIFAHCQATVINFVALLAKSKQTNSGPFFAFSFATAILFLLGFANKIDRFGKRLFLRISYPLLALPLFFIPSTFEHHLGFASAIVFGAGLGLLFPAHNALAADHGAISDKPGVMSLFTATYDTGFVTGTAISGWVAQIAGLDQLFSVTSVVALTGFITVLVAPIRRQ